MAWRAGLSSVSYGNMGTTWRRPAAALGLSRVVWASSETTLGLPFDVLPRYAPVDEDHYPVPTTTYALSKVASETAAGHLAQWSGTPFVAAQEPDVAGNPAFIIAAADTVMNQPSSDLMAKVFPAVPLARPVGEFGTLLSIDRARKALGYEPRHSWRDQVFA